MTTRLREARAGMNSNPLFIAAEGISRYSKTIFDGLAERYLQNMASLASNLDEVRHQIAPLGLLGLLHFAEYLEFAV